MKTFRTSLPAAFFCISSLCVAQGSPDRRRDDDRSGTPKKLTTVQLLSSFPFGVNVHIANDTNSRDAKSLNCVQEMHMGWVRVDGSWAMIEPVFAEPPKYEWGLPDEMVKSYHSRGLKVLWILGGTPNWATATNTPGHSNGTLKDDVARRHWRLFVHAVAERYTNDIHYFEVWNEPNLEDFWVGSVDEYVQEILVPAYEELKAVSREHMMVAPALALLRSSARISTEDFFDGMKRLDASSSIDVVSQHIYKDPEGIIEEFEEGECSFYFFGCWFGYHAPLFGIYRDAGLEGKPIWLTEFGWQTNKIGEIRQANNILGLWLALAARPQFENAFIYEMGDDSHWPDKYGLIREDGTPKEIYNRLLGIFSSPPKAGVHEDDHFDFTESGTIVHDPAKQ